MKTKSPSFQLYPQDFIASRDCQLMSFEEFGIFMWLLIHSWIQDEQCYLRNNPKEICKLLRISPRTWNKSWINLSKMFSRSARHNPKTGDIEDVIYNEKLLSIWHKQQRHYQSCVENGKKGGRPCKEIYNPRDMKEETHGLPHGLSDMETHGVTQEKPFSSSSSGKQDTTTKGGNGVSPTAGLKPNPDQKPVMIDPFVKVIHHISVTYHKFYRVAITLTEKERKILNNQITQRDAPVIMAAWDQYLIRCKKRRLDYRTIDINRFFNMLPELLDWRWLKAEAKKYDDTTTELPLKLKAVPKFG